MTEKQTNGFQSPKIAESPDFVFIDLLYTEVKTLRPLMADYFRAIKEPLEAEEVRLNKHLEFISACMRTNSLVRLYAAYSEMPDFPLNIEGEPVGYIYFWVNFNIHQEAQLFIDQFYIKPEYRKYRDMKIHLPVIAVEFTERTGYEIGGLYCEARTMEAQEMWVKMGFKVTGSKLEFKGSIQDFKDYKLSALNRNRKVEPSWDLNKHRSQNPAQKQP